MAIEFTHEPQTPEGRLLHLLQSGCDVLIDPTPGTVSVRVPPTPAAPPVYPLFLDQQTAPDFLVGPGLRTVYFRVKQTGRLKYPSLGICRHAK